MRYNRWTKSAIDCYERGCICEGCETKTLMEQRCQMKASVIELVRTIGIPEYNYNEIFPNIDAANSKIIKAILSGANTNEEIAEQVEFSVGTVKQKINEICKYAQEAGCIFSSKYNKLPELVKYLRSAPKLYRPQKNYILDDKEKTMYDNDLKIEYTETYKPLIDAIKKGYRTIKELSEQTGIAKQTLFVQIETFLKQQDIAINPELSKRENLIEFIEGKLFSVHNEETEKEAAKEEAQPSKEFQKAAAKIDRKIALIQENLAEKDENENNQLPDAELSEAENKVLNLLLQGNNYDKIAEILIISVTTVKTHVSNIYIKRNYHSLQELLCAEFKKERESLNTKINELEQKATVFSLSELKNKFQKQIKELQNKLTIIEQLEKGA